MGLSHHLATLCWLPWPQSGGTETIGASIEWRCDGSGLLTEAFRLKETLIDSGLLTEAMEPTDCCSDGSGLLNEAKKLGILHGEKWGQCFKTLKSLVPDV